VKPGGPRPLSRMQANFAAAASTKRGMPIDGRGTHCRGWTKHLTCSSTRRNPTPSASDALNRRCHAASRRRPAHERCDPAPDANRQRRCRPRPGKWRWRLHSRKRIAARDAAVPASRIAVGEPLCRNAVDLGPLPASGTFAQGCLLAERRRGWRVLDSDHLWRPGNDHASALGAGWRFPRRAREFGRRHPGATVAPQRPRRQRSRACIGAKSVRDCRSLGCE
jgi:hypothetical protein